MMRIVPANPLNISLNFSQISDQYFIFNPNEFVSLQSIKIFNFNENNNNQTSIRSTQINNQQNVIDCTADYPFIYKTRLFFFVRQRNNFPSTVPYNNHSVS